jgi:hypothetical protein
MHAALWHREEKVTSRRNHASFYHVLKKFYHERSWQTS